MRRGGEVVEEHAVAEAGNGVLGIHVDVLERRRRDGRDGVDLGPERADRRDERGALRLGAEVEGLDADERAAAKRLGDVGDRRELEQPADGGHVVGHVGGPLAPGVEDLARALDRARA